MSSTVSPSTNPVWTTTKLRGYCLCTGCTFVIDPTTPLDDATATSIRNHFKSGLLYKTGYDHCQPCRRGASSLVVSWLFVPIAWMTWTVESAKHLKMYPSSRGEVERTFCGTCGTSFTYFCNTRAPFVDVNMATLGEEDLQKVEELGLLPTYHGRWGSGIGWVQKVWENAAKAGYEVNVRVVKDNGEKVLETLTDFKEREKIEREKSTMV